MKKVLLLSAFAFLMFATSFKAQAIEDPNPKGTMVIGIRAGFLPGFGGNVVGDYTLVDSWWKGHFTVGGYAGFNTRIYNWGNYSSHYSNIAVMPRATYGLNITKSFEVHAGVMLGVNFQLDRWVYNSTTLPNETYNHWYFSHGELVGARFMFTNSFGAEVEFIYSGYQSYLNAGITLKF